MPRVNRVAAAGGCAALVATLLTTGAAAPPRPLDVAVGAAKWIRQARVTTAAGVTWPANPADAKSTSTSLYSGSPGVGLFLLELHRATGKREYLDDARKGADDLIARLPEEKGSGLYEGIAGLGFTFGETWRATGDVKYREAARLAARMLSERATTVGRGIQWSDTTDIISGTAGTGLFLLYAADVLEDHAAKGLAISAGERLIQLAVPDRGGLRWSMDPTFPRLMPNFSHGTAGVAYFLASLYRATREPRALDAALAGGRYLQSIANTDDGVCLIPHHQPDGLQLYYLGWCHGPAGTARVFYRLWQVTGDDAWMEWVRRSAKAVTASGIPERRTDGFWNNVSQCCGSAGVAQFFLDLYGATRDRQYFDFSQRMTRDLLARATTDRRGTRWVQAENRVQPDVIVAQTGYMQGAAGIGMWFLHLDAAERGRTTFIDFPDSPWQAR